MAWIRRTIADSQSVGIRGTVGAVRGSGQLLLVVEVLHGAFCWCAAGRERGACFCTRKLQRRELLSPKWLRIT
eukprot:4746466-Heterocapsa_arctica.AAC.1